MKETLYDKIVREFVAFCKTHEITHLHDTSLPFRIFNAKEMEFDLAKQMIGLCNAYMRENKKILLDIRLLGFRNVRAFVAFSAKNCGNNFGAWHYGFSTGNKLAFLDKKIIIDSGGNIDSATAVEIIAKELRAFAIKYILRKPYILFNPKVLKSISLW